MDMGIWGLQIDMVYRLKSCSSWSCGAGYVDPGVGCVGCVGQALSCVMQRALQAVGCLKAWLPAACVWRICLAV